MTQPLRENTKATDRPTWCAGWIAIGVAMMLLSGCPRKVREDLDYTYDVQQNLKTSDFQSGSLVQFEGVDWDDDDRVDLRSLIVEDNVAAGRDVLLIGVGPGLIAMLCQQHGAGSVIGTDTNPADIANAQYNIAVMELDADIEIRQATNAKVFSAIKPAEKFELIILDSVDQIFAKQTGGESIATALDLFLGELPNHLKPGGRCIVMCRHSDQIELCRLAATDSQYQSELLGDRDITAQQGRLYPAIPFEIRIPMDVYNAAATDDSE